MEKFWLYFGIGSGMIISFLGGADNLLVALMAFIVIDFATGMLSAVISGNLSSKVGHRGVLKKLAYFLMVGFAHVVDVYVIQVESDYKFRALAIVLILANEGISILENLAELGVPIPKKLLGLFESMKNKNNEDSPNQEQGYSSN